MREAASDPSCRWRFKADQGEFSRIPGAPLAYWISPRLRRLFELNHPLGKAAPAAIGLNTGDNRRFLRRWYEVDFSRIGFGFLNLREAAASGKKWLPYNKGGALRRWAGNQEYVIDWQDDGAAVKEFAVRRNRGRHWSRYIQNLKYMCRPGVTWTFVSSAYFGVRFQPSGFLFDVAGSAVFPPPEKQMLVLAFLSSSFAVEALKALNPTLNFQAGNIEALPFVEEMLEPYRAEMERLAEEAVGLAQSSWDEKETSWGFRGCPLLGAGIKGATIEESVLAYRKLCGLRAARLIEIEERINRLVIRAYGLEGEISCAPVNDGAASEPADVAEIARELVSYLAGCLMGRYRPDELGLRRSAGNETPVAALSEDFAGVADAAQGCAELIGRLWGEAEAARNLGFLVEALSAPPAADSLGRLRAYLMRSFFRDHLRLYRGRPIYWPLGGGTRRAVRGLIYAHRSTPEAWERVAGERCAPLEKIDLDLGVIENLKRMRPALAPEALSLAVKDD